MQPSNSLYYMHASTCILQNYFSHSIQAALLTLINTVYRTGLICSYTVYGIRYADNTVYRSSDIPVYGATIITTSDL
jgi:hypothetical protein